MCLRIELRKVQHLIEIRRAAHAIQVLAGKILYPAFRATYPARSARYSNGGSRRSREY